MEETVHQEIVQLAIAAPLPTWSAFLIGALCIPGIRLAASVLPHMSQEEMLMLRITILTGLMMSDCGKSTT